MNKITALDIHYIDFLLQKRWEFLDGKRNTLRAYRDIVELNVELGQLVALQVKVEKLLR